jgi:hypothetical protein
MAGEHGVLRIALLVTLYTLAAPIYIVRRIASTVRTLTRFRVVRAGVVTCPHCHNDNALDILATCRRCGVTEFGSRLRCSNCRQFTPGLACDFCGALIRVL